jgi:cytochrome c551/c552
MKVTDNAVGSKREHDNNQVGSDPASPDIKDTGLSVNGANLDTGATGTVAGQTIMTSGPHGKFVSNTNACGRCHQLHAAQSSRLIRFKTDTSKNTIYGICTYCHSFNGQSTYDVRNGQIWDTNDGKRYATNGGGFENMLVVEGAPSVATYAAVTARHAVDINAGGGNTEPVKFKAPGGNSSGLHVQLKCTACHQPHGTENDRLLVESVTQGDDTFYSYASKATTDSLGKNLTVGQGSFTGASGKVTVAVEKPFNDEQTYYNAKIIDFCASCHVDYAAGATFDGNNLTGNMGNLTDSSSANRSSRKSNGHYDKEKYRHMMNMKASEGLNGVAKVDNTYGYNAENLLLPLATVGKASGDGVVVCTTCHYAHGTFTNKNSGIKTYDEIDLGSEAVSAGYGPSGTPGKLNILGGQETAKNLRLDDRGVCQNCHNRNPDTTKPSLIDVLNPDVVVTDTTTNAGTVNATNVITGSSGKAVVVGTDTVVIRFAQYMQEGTAETLTNYTFSAGGNPTAAVLQQDKRTVVLTKAGIAAGGTLAISTNVKNTNGVAVDSSLNAVPIVSK